MSLDEVVLEGTLKPDGTLELDEKPSLAPGRVTVVLRQGAETQSPRPLDAAFFHMMEDIWARQKASGHVPRGEAEVEAERRRFREESEAEVEAAIRLQEESRRLRQEADNGKESP